MSSAAAILRESRSAVAVAGASVASSKGAGSDITAAFEGASTGSAGIGISGFGVSSALTRHPLLDAALAGRALLDDELTGRAPSGDAPTGRALLDDALTGHALPGDALTDRAFTEGALIGGAETDASTTRAVGCLSASSVLPKASAKSASGMRGFPDLTPTEFYRPRVAGECRRGDCRGLHRRCG